MEQASSHSRILKFGVFEVDLEARELRKSGMRQKLTGQPFQVLQLLLEHPHEIVTRDELRQRIWPQDTFVDYDLALKKAVNRIREVLGDSAESPRFVETIPRHGYRFIGFLYGTSRNSPQETSVTTTKAVTTSHGHFRVLTLGALGLMLVGGFLFGLDIGGLRSRLLLRLYPPPAIHSLAVLPLQNLSDDPAQEYFSDGMTDALITDLAQIATLKVISRTSTTQYKQAKKTLPEIARELNVDGIIEGTVQRSGDSVRITAQLIHGPSDKHIWANSYERKMSDVFALERDVTEDIARQVQARLTPNNPLEQAKPRSIDPRAHDAYLKGKLYFDNYIDLGKSAAFFEEAIRVDPNYAAAYGALAQVYLILGEAPYDVLSPREADRRARMAAQRALELDPSLAQAHAALGLAARNFDWDLRTAEREYRLALELNPNDPSAHELLGTVFMIEGKTKEALEEGQRSLDLDPVSPGCHAFVAQAYYYEGDYDKAIEQARHIVEIQPRFIQALYWLGSAYREKKMYKEAIEQFRLAREASGNNPAMVMGYGHAQAMAGNPAEARAALHLLDLRREKQHVPGIYYAGLYIGLRDYAKAIKYLNEAYEERNDRLIYLGVDPMLNPLRSEPRFKELLRRVGLRQ
jgi:TolB-like protein/DNA-binding winged helix-turn-helix (wHTH) protein/Tfp pilus assembly protein PilF